MADQENNEDEEQQEDAELDYQTEQNAKTQSVTPEDGVELTPQTQPPLVDEKRLPIADGAIPQDSSGISSGTYNAISPTGEVDIKFQSGNYQQVTSLPKIIENKVQQVTNTLVPLLEISLIELLGSSGLYQREIGDCNTSLENNQCYIDFTFKYTVNLWISQEVDQEAIMADANYVLNKLKMMPDINITVCQIDCKDGSLLVQGRI